MSKRISAIALLVALLFMLTLPALAQEPTEPVPEATEAAPVVTDEGSITVVNPQEGGSVVVINPSTDEQGVSNEQAEDTADNAEETADEANSKSNYAFIVSIATAVGFAVSLFLSPKFQKQFRDYTEGGEHYAWIGAALISDIIQAVGGRRDVVTSKDPKILAQALKSKDTHVFLTSDVDFNAVVREYQQL